jgi:putative addiction module killer protein
VVEVRQSTVFRKWFAGLRDIRAKAQINRRIERAEAGNLGDAKYFDGIGEMRIDYGPDTASTSSSEAGR